LTTLAKARIISYDRNCSFIVLATVITIVNYGHETFTVQATGLTSDKRSSLFVRIFNDEDEKFL